MFEMFATIMAGVLAALYALSRSLFMNGPHRQLYRAAFIIFVVVAYLIHKIYHTVKKRLILKMKVNPEEYCYYDKYTSPLYRAGYYLSYLVQNIFFDYSYMSRNYNFCKGLDIYDGGVSEYYIKFRNTWYQYIKLINLRHKISLRKLVIFSCDMKNGMIIEALATEEERSSYLAFQKEAEAFCQKYHGINNNNTVSLPHYSDVVVLYRNNIVKRCRALACIEKYQPKLIEMVERQSYHKDKDINDYKKTDFR